MNYISKALLALTASFCLHFGAIAQFDADDSYMNDIQPIEVDGKFEPLGESLAGDSLEHDRGTLSFRHVDVSIPGNSHLPVEFARTYTVHGTANTGNQLGGWQIDVPFITVRMRNGGFAPGGPGHSHFGTDSCFLNSWDRAFTNPDDVSAYYQGFKMNIPGEGMKQIMDVPTGAAVNFPYDSQYDRTATTTDHWQIYCEPGGGSPTGAVIAVSPQGDKYEFRKFSSTFAGFEIITKSTGGRRGNMYQAPTFTYHFNLLATKVTDVHGNWVEYDYEKEFDYNQNYQVCTVYTPAINAYACADNLNGSNYKSYRLKAITSNDARQIDIAYNSVNYDPIVPSLIQTPEEGFNTTVSSVSANGRTWTYTYETPQGPSSPLNAFRRLKRVDLPDGRHWFLNLPLQNHRAYRHYNSYQCTAVDNSNYTRPWVMDWLSDIYVKHPSGARVDFDFQLIKNPIWKLGALSTITNSVFCNNPDPEYTISNAVIRKTITAPSAPTAIWNFSYDQTAFNDPNLGEVKRRVETRPDGATVERMVLINNEGDTVRTTISGTGVNYVEENTVTKIAVFDEYDTSVGVLDDHKRYKNPTLKRTTQSEITSDGDTFSTVTSFNTNLASSNYSYGAPTSITQTGTGSGSRNASVTYIHERDDWVLSLVNTVTKNGKLFDDLDYDAKGRVTRHKKFGITTADITYYTSGDAAGRINTLSDALGRTHTLSSYKRGVARTILRPDSSTITRVVDDNGWVTSQTDGNGNTTGYAYNSMGWLSTINRPGFWADTSISYSNLGSGLIQTTTRGDLRTTTTMDGYHRTILTKAEDLTGHSSARHSKMSYDGLGREVFSSWPSNSANPTAGVDTTYDALGRTTQVRETVSPQATTSKAYLSGHRIRVTDPSGAQTTTTYRSYGAPSTDEVVSVVDATGTTTTMTRDIWGNITNLNQSSGLNGYTVNVDRKFWYDNSFRLCRHRAPEFGDELFAYNNANELTYSSRGENAGSGCTFPSYSVRTDFSYDQMGRQTGITFRSGTPSISKTYDSNGNLLTVNRGGANWSYTYDELDQMSAEHLLIDGRGYSIVHTRNASGHLDWRWHTGGNTETFDPNGFGEPRSKTFGSTPLITSTTYHPNGAVASAAYGNGKSFTQSLTARQQPYETITDGLGGKVLHKRYAYDARGKITSSQDFLNSAINKTFTYDSRGRLLTANGLWGNGSFKYDGLDNVREKILGNRVIQINYDAAKNRAASFRDTTEGNAWQSLFYDTRGNMVDNGTSTYGAVNITYDWANQPTSMTGTGISSAHTYDGNLKRVKTVVNGKTTYWVYSALTGTPVYSDDVTDGVTTSYLAGGGTRIRIKNGLPYYSHLDQTGSAVSETDTNANVLWWEDYSPFGGKQFGPSGNQEKIGYTGHVQDDATGLTYMQARYYDPVIGRFLSTDPIGYQDQMNLYAYVYNDPVNHTDPTGMFGDTWGDDDLRAVLTAQGASEAEIQQAYADSRAGGQVLLAGAAMLSPVDETFAVAFAAKKAFDGLRAAGAALKGGKAASGLGDLSKAEVGQIQSVVDEAGRPLDVVGSAASGQRRNVGSDLPIGKGAGTRSDTDFTTAGANHDNFSGLEGKLPNADPNVPLLKGTPETGNPSIRFEPNTRPRKIDEN